jgi:hypothetical protein
VLLEEYTSKLESVINEIYSMLPDYTLLIKLLVDKCLANPPGEYHYLKLELTSQVGVPIMPMLSKAIKGMGEI